MTVTLKQLETFHAVVVTGSISRAARRMGLAQPTVSQQLAKMEEVLGTPLFLRNRSAELSLTPAGEYWFRCAGDLIGDFQAAMTKHDHAFGGSRLVMRFGVTPSLHGRFLGAAARIAVAEARFSRFNFVWGITSGDLVEQMTLHQLDCAIVSDMSVEAHRDLFSVTPLFRDSFVWLVPASIPEALVREVLITRSDPGPGYEAMGRYVDVGPGLPLTPVTESWYRSNLPFAMPYFGCLTYQAAVDLVAAGLATCHCPLSLYPNLTKATAERLRVYELDGIERDAVLIMPRHLASIGAFARFRDEITGFIRNEYSEEMRPQMRDMPESGTGRGEGAASADRNVA